MPRYPFRLFVSALILGLCPSLLAAKTPRPGQAPPNPAVAEQPTASQASTPSEAVSQTGSLPPTQATLSAQWHHAQALIAEGDFAAALPILRKLLRMEPEPPRLRGELAFLHARLGQRATARRELQKITAEQPKSPRLAAALTALSTHLTPQNGWRFHLRAGLVPQSNLGRQTSAERISIGGLSFILNERPQSGIGLDISASATHLHEGPVWSRNFELSASGKLYEAHRWNDWSLGMGASFARDIAAGQLRVGTLTRLRFIADRRYSRDLGGWIGFDHPLGAKLQTSLRATAIDRQVFDARRQDAELYSLSLGTAWQPTRQTSLRLNLNLMRGHSAAPEVITAETALSLTAQHRFDNGLTLEMTASQTRAKGQGRIPLFDATRRERETALRLRASHSDLKIWGLTPVLGLSLERRRSNIAVYDWDNRQIELFWVKQF